MTLYDDAEQIRKRSDRKYGDEGKLFDSILSDVKNIPKCDDNSPRVVLDMITIIEKAYWDIRFLSMEQEICNSTVVSLIEQILPKSIEDELLKIVTGEDRIAVGRDKFPHLLKLLIRHKEKVEYTFSDMRCIESKQADVLLADRRKHKCWIHTESGAVKSSKANQLMKNYS